MARYRVYLDWLESCQGYFYVEADSEEDAYEQVEPIINDIERGMENPHHVVEPFTDTYEGVHEVFVDIVEVKEESKD